MREVPKPSTIYANVVNIRTTQTELILDFGVQLDSAAETPDQENFEPEVRVIVPVGATRSLGELLLRTAQQHDKASQPQKDAPQKAEG